MEEKALLTSDVKLVAYEIQNIEENCRWSL